MSKLSENVKNWRKRCKDRIIIAMGGSCCLCGYKKCQSALALHHLDPTEKDFSFGAVRANPKNWSALVVELRKCILVCHNCHSEIHCGISDVPLLAPRFDEAFADYKLLEISTNDKVNFNECPVCGKLKLSHLINCSVECAGKAKRKIDWDLINLEEELKIKSVLQLAEEIGCSDGAVYKRRKKLGLK